MPANDDQIRAVVRDVIARHLEVSDQPVRFGPDPHARLHPSHSQYARLVNETDACLIEPAVPCNHCGYCKSHGH